MAGAAAKKAPANGKTTKAAAEKAVAELAAEPREGEFRGVKLTLPGTLPATFALDLAEVQAGEGGNDLAPTYRLLVGLLGPEQWQRVRAKIAADGDSMDDIADVLQELLGAVTDPYGVDPGE